MSTQEQKVDIEDYLVKLLDDYGAPDDIRQHIHEFLIGSGHLYTLLCHDQAPLVAVCKELFKGAIKTSEAPYFMVQPWFGIIKRHSTVIKEHKLIEE